MSSPSKAQRLDDLVRKLLRAMSADNEDPLNHLPLAQLKVVRVLSTGEKSAGDVGQELGFSPSALSQLIQRLSYTGLIVKEEDSSDRRVKRISLSESGAQKVRDRDTIRHSKATALLGGLDEKDQDLLLDLLERLVSVKPTGRAILIDDSSL